MGPATLGFGDEEDDRYINFIRVDDKTQLVIASQYVLRFKNSQQANEWYRNSLPSTNVLVTPGITDRVIKVEGLNFQSERATQFSVGCDVVHGPRHSCKFVAQYDDYGVEFFSIVSHSVLTVNEFNRLIQVIDQKFTLHLGDSK
jgi:hypothetical protein